MCVVIHLDVIHRGYRDVSGESSSKTLLNFTRDIACGVGLLRDLERYPQGALGATGT